MTKQLSFVGKSPAGWYDDDEGYVHNVRLKRDYRECLKGIRKLEREGQALDEKLTSERGSEKPNTRNIERMEAERARLLTIVQAEQERAGRMEAQAVAEGWGG